MISNLINYIFSWKTKFDWLLNQITLFIMQFWQNAENIYFYSFYGRTYNLPKGNSKIYYGASLHCPLSQSVFPHNENDSHLWPQMNKLFIYTKTHLSSPYLKKIDPHLERLFHLLCNTKPRIFSKGSVTDGQQSKQQFTLFL